ncbi:unnamed protein product [Rangifer tarandus platyrhynchus]|uniref:Uncharacterized protein n=1 Tax=Rangifer tarandus platyrhynchus TaxID=3082113 RepID=A0ACB1KFX8_RANTA
METFCETVQFYLRHLEDSVYPVMPEDQFALKLFPMYRYFLTVWLRNNTPEVCSRAPAQQRFSSQNLAEIVHSFIAPARSYPKELMQFFLSQMEMSKEAIRVGTLALIGQW